MAVNVYYSTDAGAPALSNAAGSLITVLDACLVNGYGSKSAAGWTKPYSSSTTGASYRSGTGSNQFYLNVDDTQPHYAMARGYETMSAFDTGTGLFPTVATMSGGVFFQKTNNTAGNRPWVVVANAKIFYFFTAWDTSATHANYSTWFCFGDFISTKPGDAYNTIIIGGIGTGMSTAASNASSTSYVPYYGFIDAMFPGHYVARPYTQTGISTVVSKQVDLARLGSGTPGTWLNSYSFTYGVGANSVPYPNLPDGGIYVSPVWISEPGSYVRGKLPGLWLFQGRTPLNHKDTYTGSGDLSGKTFTAVNSWASQFHIETSDTWY